LNDNSTADDDDDDDDDDDAVELYDITFSSSHLGKERKSIYIAPLYIV